ncbi:vWA domain-containing protein [Poriferisphaera sp. WC338]|uniref:vWA domain-containing protein n=1 Tax=Poriferisphaera sp. WC338 TaxID=3425129 RepID=UPI003D81BD5C
MSQESSNPSTLSSTDPPQTGEAAHLALADLAVQVAEQGDDLQLEDDKPEGFAAYAPWLISGGIHLILILIAIFAVWTTVTVIQDQQIVVPNIRLSDTPGSPLTQTDFKPLEQTSNTARRSITQIDTPQTTLNVKPVTEVPMIGLAGGASKINPFAADMASGAEFKTNFFGSGGNARKIIFVVDASGSLIDTMKYVLLELQKTIRNLSDKQTFTVIFFQGNEVFEVPPKGLKQATASQKQAVIDWIDPRKHNVVPSKQTNPIKALTQALKYKPGLIYLLSDNITGQGQYEVNQKHLLREIARANHSNTKINTIQFLYHDPLEELGRPGTMPLIAEGTGGVYRFVTEDELYQ